MNSRRFQTEVRKIDRCDRFGTHGDRQNYLPRSKVAKSVHAFRYFDDERDLDALHFVTECVPESDHRGDGTKA